MSEQYYPLQIPYLLDEEFQAHVLYKEHRIQELDNYCMCIWEMRSKKILDKTIYNYILPDACIDIVVDFTSRTICFAGFSKDTIPFELNQKIDHMGVRMKPGAFYLLYGISAEQVMDHPIVFSKAERSDCLDEIFVSTDTRERLRILKNYLLRKIQGSSDTVFLKLADQLYKSPIEQSVTIISDEFHYNKRQLYRIFKTNYGISPKVMLNILRLHLCLTLVLTQSISFAEVACLCGFYDQSHFIKEIKRYTGFSPLQLLETYQRCPIFTIQNPSASV